MKTEQFVQTEQLSIENLLSKPSITSTSDTLSDKIKNITKLTDVMTEKINDIESTVENNSHKFYDEINSLNFCLNKKLDSYHQEWFESLSKVDNKLSGDIAEIKTQLFTMIKLQEYTHKNTKFSKLKKLFKCNEGKNHTYKVELHHPNFVTVNRCEVCGEIEINILGK